MTTHVWSFLGRPISLPELTSFALFHALTIRAITRSYNTSFYQAILQSEKNVSRLTYNGHMLNIPPPNHNGHSDQYILLVTSSSFA